MKRLRRGVDWTGRILHLVRVCSFSGKQTSKKLFLNPKIVASGGSPFVDDRIRWVCKNINTKRRHANVKTICLVAQEDL